VAATRPDALHDNEGGFPMSQPVSQSADLPDRVTRLEQEMAEVRFVAYKAEKEASDSKDILHGQVGVLNAIRADQLDLRKDFTKLNAYVEGIDGRVGKLDERFGKLDERVGRVEERVGRVEERVGKVDEHLGKVDERVGKVDERVGKVEERVGKVDARVGKVDERLGKVETEVREGFAEMRQGFGRVDSEMTGMRGEMHETRGEIAVLAQGQERITELLVRHVGDCESDGEP
jgi:chromosome segregation ATPase